MEAVRAHQSTHQERWQLTRAYREFDELCEEVGPELRVFTAMFREASINATRADARRMAELVSERLVDAFPGIAELPRVARHHSGDVWALLKEHMIAEFAYWGRRKTDWQSLDE